MTPCKLLLTNVRSRSRDLMTADLMTFTCRMLDIISTLHTFWCQGRTHVTVAFQSSVVHGTNTQNMICTSYIYIFTFFDSSQKETLVSQKNKMVVSDSIYLSRCCIKFWHSVCCPGHWDTSETKWVQRASNEQSSHTQLSVYHSEPTSWCLSMVLRVSWHQSCHIFM